MRDQLKAGLSRTAHLPDDDEGPSVAEMAEKIKTLKAGHNIDATPQRARQKHSTAEEPVTARIRRRAERNFASHSHAGTESEVAQPPAMPQDSSGNPPKTFQERIALERKPKSEGPDPANTL